VQREAVTDRKVIARALEPAHRETVALEELGYFALAAYTLVTLAPAHVTSQEPGVDE
jgi:hypothetical protein